MGRPPADNPKLKRIYVRIDDEAMRTLDELAKTKGMTKSEIIRQGIHILRARLITKGK